jgi:hypothetical protein
METTNYFQHDYRSRVDKKLLKIRMQHQMTGVGVYWSLVEMLHENNGIIDMDLEMIAYELQTDELIVKDVIDICFEYIDGTITSERVIKNLNYRRSKKEERIANGKKGAEKRWNKKQSDSNTNGDTMDTLYQKYSYTMVNDSKDKDKDKDKEKVKEKDIDKDTTTVSKSGSDKNIIQKSIIDVLVDANSDMELYNRAVEDYIELGIDTISEIMGWDNSVKDKHIKTIQNINSIK